MKSLLGLSLALNLVLGMMLFFNTQKKQPMVESRTFSEQPSKPKTQVVETRGHVVEAVPVAPQDKKSSKKEKNLESIPFAEEDEAGFLAQTEDIEVFRKELLERLEIREDFLDKKGKLMDESYQKSLKIFKKHPTGITMSPEERQELIQYEIEGYKKVEKFVGKEKWEKYKKAVDQYNKKLFDSAPQGQYRGPLMGY